MYAERLRRVQNTTAKVKRSITGVVRYLPEGADSRLAANLRFEER